MKVAALLDDSGYAATPQAGGTIHVFEIADGMWRDVRSIEFPAPDSSSMEQLRGRVQDICLWLDDCQVLAARATNGYYRVTFASFQVALWPVRGRPEEFVDQLANFYLQAAQQAAEPAKAEPETTSIDPVPGRMGHYHTDLRGAMGQPGAHTSKSLLLPFLMEASFQQLEVLCDHVPKWFERTLPELGLAAKIANRDDFVRVNIYPLKDRDEKLENAQLDDAKADCYIPLS